MQTESYGFSFRYKRNISVICENWDKTDIPKKNMLTKLS